MQPPRRQPLAGPDMMPMVAAPPMQFAPVAAPQGGGAPDISPLVMALRQRLSDNAQMSGNKVTSKQTDAPQRKPPLEDLMRLAQGGGYANA